MTDLDLLIEKLRQHLFGSGEFTKDDLWHLYDVILNGELELYKWQDAYDEGYEDGLEEGTNGNL